MIKVRHFATAILTIGTLAILPGCSGHEEAAAPAPTPAAAPASAPAPTPAPAAEATQEVPLTAGQIRRMQFGLSRLGLYNGPTDGVMGPQTESAVAQFQQQNSLSPTGRVDSATAQTMKSVAGIGLVGGSGGFKGMPTSHPHQLPPQE